MKIRRSSIITKLIIVILIGYAMVNLISLSSKIQSAEQAKIELEKKAAELAERNAAIEHAILNSNDPETIKSVAREKLGLVMPGEIVFYDVGG